MNWHETLSLLLHHLVTERPTQEDSWREWQIQPIVGGWNNLLYRAIHQNRAILMNRATGEIGDLAIKFTVRDERDRAGREYNALCALQQAGLDLAPQPILLDRTSFAQPVVVQSWLPGEVSDRVPTEDTEWQYWVDHLLAIHSLTPTRTTIPLLRGVITAYSVQEAFALVAEQLARIPSDEQPSELKHLYRQLQQSDFPTWAPAPSTLCRVDSNLLNFVRQPDRWLSVDWENSGWGDPAFEIADLITHVANLAVPQTRWQWLIDAYAAESKDAELVLRIQTHRKIRLLWYAARLYRYLYEMPRGLDQRLVKLPEGWQADIQAKYEAYLELSDQVL